jgi:hypothetical protein
MIEKGQILETWQLAAMPEPQNFTGCQAKKIFDHDKKFLSYQGPVNKGRGMVKLCDSGNVKIKTRDKEKLKLYFDGKNLKGNFQLRHTEKENWILEPD